MNLKLLLKDGTEIAGQSFGWWPEQGGHAVDGEVVFNTSMVGYPESFTDPSYRGQILVMTYPMIGNYGVPAEEDGTPGVSRWFESHAVHMRGLIVSEEAQHPSHWNSRETLSAFLRRHRVPAISGVDTRALTQKLREHGVMLGKIVEESVRFKPSLIFSDPNAANLVDEVSCREKTVLEPVGPVRATVALLDCGTKHAIFRAFLERGVRVIRLPWNFSLAELKEPYDGLFVSNGPGDPKTVAATIESVRHAMRADKPIFGICLGCQIMALAAGANTYKLKYGHRSANQPCVDAATERCVITSQNHGFAVDAKTLPQDWEVWFKNANDGTVEGVRHKQKPWFSVQFHPEASPGPEDAAYLFDEFLKKLPS